MPSTTDAHRFRWWKDYEFPESYAEHYLKSRGWTIKIEPGHWQQPDRHITWREYDAFTYLAWEWDHAASASPMAVLAETWFDRLWILWSEFATNKKRMW